MWIVATQISVIKQRAVQKVHLKLDTEKQEGLEK
jgi:hypothetical protein